jgi:hypothetical protein
VDHPLRVAHPGKRKKPDDDLKFQLHGMTWEIFFPVSDIERCLLVIQRYLAGSPWPRPKNLISMKNHFNRRNVSRS